MNRLIEFVRENRNETFLKVFERASGGIATEEWILHHGLPKVADADCCYCRKPVGVSLASIVFAEGVVSGEDLPTFVDCPGDLLLFYSSRELVAELQAYTLGAHLGCFKAHTAALPRSEFMALATEKTKNANERLLFAAVALGRVNTRAAYTRKDAPDIFIVR